MNSFILDLDPMTALVTAILLPATFLIVRRVSRAIRDNADAILDATLWALDRLVADSVASRMSLRLYCRTQLARDTTKFLHVPGATATALPTDTVFVPLKLESTSNDTASTVSDLWRDGASRVQVVGDPGSGKTSFIKRLFREACEAANKDRNSHLPVMVELKAFAPPQDLTKDALGVWAISFLREQVSAIRGYKMGNLFDASVGSRGMLVLLDGLDEVPTREFPRVTDAIISLCSQLDNAGANNRLVVTMRSQFYQQIRDRLADVVPTVYHIQPFSPNDIFTFLTRWPFGKRINRQEAINRIFSELTDRPTLREMCTNPLVLAMYVANDQIGTGAGASDTRTRFYSQVAEELLVARRSRQLAQPAKATLRVQRERLLGGLAFDNLMDGTQPANVVSWNFAVGLTKGIYRSHNDEDAAAVLRDVCKETGIISEERPSETLRFIHLTFCEFMAAKEAVNGRSEGWREMIDAHKGFAAGPDHVRTRLIESIPFTVGLLPRVRHHEAIDHLTDVGDRSILGRVFLETQAYDHPAWSGYATDEATSLTSVSESGWDEVWLRKLHLLNVVLADEAYWRRAHNVAARSITVEQLLGALVADNEERLLALFGSYASVDPQAAFRMASAFGIDLICEHPGLVVDNLDNRPFFSLVMEHLTNRTTHSALEVLVLCEAALKNPLVAFNLHMGPSFVLKGRPPEGIARSNRWFLTGPKRYKGLPLSLLTYAFSLAYQEGDQAHHATFRRMSLLRSRVSAPGSQGFSWLIRWRLSQVASVIGAILWITSVALLMGNFREEVSTGRALMVFLPLLVSSVLMQVGLYTRRRASAYLRLLCGSWLPESATSRRRMALGLASRIIRGVEERGLRDVRRSIEGL